MQRNLNKRCLNIDWLEIYCLEDITSPLTAERLIQNGVDVNIRPYGTRVYNEMFSVNDEFGFPMIEVRRNPCGTIEQGSVLPINACHIRLVNRYCYCRNPVKLLSNFCYKYGVTIERVSRIDLCLDFEKFDFGDDPQRFINRYIKGKFTKVNQANVHAHGTDTWERRCWNSLSWGSPCSPIGTKIYCKTLELKQVKDKPYIRQAWFESGLIDEPRLMTKADKNGQQKNVIIWRLEFSIKSPVRNWVRIEVDGNYKNYQSIKNTLTIYETKEGQLAVFQSLVQHYFHFKHYIYGKTKYDCPDKQLFNFNTNEAFYSVEHPSSNLPKSTELARLEKYLESYKLKHIDPQVNACISVLLKAIKEEDLARLLANPYNREELIALQQAISFRLKGYKRDPAEIVEDIIQNIKNNDTKIF